MTDETLLRLDKLIVDKGLAANRTEAEQLIKTYGVLGNGKLLTKPGKKIKATTKIEKVVETVSSVSVREAILNKALNHFKIDIKQKIALDIGAGAGGFTNVLLQKDAYKIYALDKRKGLLNDSLRQSDKVLNLENTQVRELTTSIVKLPVDFCAIDVDDTKTELVLPFCQAFIAPNSDVILVVKPQLEVDKKEVFKGLVKNHKLFSQVIAEVKKIAELSNLDFQDSIESPILGEHSNKEFILYFKKK